MNISVFGLGYVGTVSAACLASEGHVVTGVDTVHTKVDMIKNAQSPIIEKEIDSIIRSAVADKCLKATHSTREAVMETDISLICVGTPSRANGDLDTQYIERVCRHIGTTLADKNNRHLVVIRSTILPGTIDKTVIPIIESCSGKSVGSEIGICSNPEFLREGTAVFDFFNPPKTIIGATDEKSAHQLARLYQHLDAPVFFTDIKTAEMIKYVDNTWHALKVAFANEMGNISKAHGIDSHKVMDIFCKDTKLNISPTYLKPGFAFGGSCLPKDVRALSYIARSLDLNLPILNSILPSNNTQVEKAIQMVLDAENRKIGFLGFSFKEGTDDLRESPVVEMIERLLGKGFEIKIYDKNVNLAALIGANRNYILNKIPHIAKLMVTTVDDVLTHSDTLIIGNNSIEFKNLMSRTKNHQVIIDLVRALENKKSQDKYKGIAW